MSGLSTFISILKKEIETLNKLWGKVEDDWGKLGLLDGILSLKIDTGKVFTLEELAQIEKKRGENLPIHFKNFLLEYGCFSLKAEAIGELFSIETCNPILQLDNFKKFLQTTLDEKDPKCFFLRSHYDNYRILMKFGTWACDFSGGIVYNINRVNETPTYRGLFIYENDDLWIPASKEEAKSANREYPIKEYNNDIFENTIIRELKRFYLIVFRLLSNGNKNFDKGLDDEFEYYINEVKGSSTQEDIEMYNILNQVLSILKNMNRQFLELFKKNGM